MPKGGRKNLLHEDIRPLHARCTQHNIVNINAAILSQSGLTDGFDWFICRSAMRGLEQ